MLLFAKALLFHRGNLFPEMKCSQGCFMDRIFSRMHASAHYSSWKPTVDKSEWHSEGPSEAKDTGAFPQIRTHSCPQIIQTVESNDSYQRDLESIMTIVDLAGSERLTASVPLPLAFFSSYSCATPSHHGCGCQPATTCRMRKHMLGQRHRVLPQWALHCPGLFNSIPLSPCFNCPDSCP